MAKSLLNLNPVGWKATPEQRGQWNRQAYLNLRAKAIAALGGKCLHCGFSDERALQIDHKNGGGGIELKSIGALKIYKAAKDGHPDYQLLCANCNWIKRAEMGECPKRFT